MKLDQTAPETSHRLLHGAACLSLLLVLTTATTITSAAEAGPPVSVEPMDPELAFVPTAKRVNAQTIEVSYNIALGHYMYRDRFRVADATGKLAKPAGMPKGRVTEDPTFGRVETYRGNVRLLFKAAEHPPGGNGFTTLRIVGQGCAEAGICYPPMTHNFQLGLQIGNSTPGTYAGAGFNRPRDTAQSTSPSPVSAGPKSLSDVLHQQTPKPN